MRYQILYSPAETCTILCRSYTDLPFIYAWFSLTGNNELRVENTTIKNETLANCFTPIGIKTIFTNKTTQLLKTPFINAQPIIMDFETLPELAILIAIICAAKGIQADLKGLKSLREKYDSSLIPLFQRELYRLNINSDFCDYSKLKIFNTKNLAPTKKPLNVESYDFLSLFFLLFAVPLGKIEIELQDNFFESQSEIIPLLSSVNISVIKTK